MQEALQRFWFGYNLELANALDSGRFTDLKQASDFAFRSNLKRSTAEEKRAYVHELVAEIAAEDRLRK